MAPKKGPKTAGNGRRVMAKKTYDLYMTVMMMVRGFTVPEIAKVNGISETCAWYDLIALREIIQKEQVKLVMITAPEVANHYIELGTIAKTAARLGLEDGIRIRDARLREFTTDDVIRNGGMPSPGRRGAPADPYPYGNPEYIEVAGRMFDMALKAVNGEFVGQSRVANEGRQAMRHVTDKMGIADMTFQTVMAEALNVDAEMVAKAEKHMEEVIATR